MFGKANGSWKTFSALVAFAVVVAGAAIAHSDAQHQIDLNKTAIGQTDGRLIRIERLLVVIAQNDGIDVSGLFGRKDSQ